MRISSSRPGSALLVVLGMMAFMVISAVAFSAFMRAARLPSNYLRRTAASRQLVKAGLARAIDLVDASIGNNPHPGVGSLAYDYPRGSGSSSNRNWWVRRVYTGCRPEQMPDSDETVSPLCLEALAYLPPNLVNDVRYYSRHSSAASWKALGFDAGRYAFCCVDVSDYFDVNRLFAGKARSSASNRRVTLNYLFEPSTHASAASGADQWDTFMKRFRTVDDNAGTMSFADRLPLVSLADMNLAMGKSTFGGLKSPFCSFIGGNGDFYNCGETDDDANRFRSMTFVTDGYFPPTKEEAAEGDAIDISGDQPFEKGALMGKKKPNLMEIGTGGSSESYNRLKQYLPIISLAALRDYLDVDRVPSSLAIPTTERVPMFCGVKAKFDNLKFAVKEKVEPEQNEQPQIVKESETERTVRRTFTYSLDRDALLESLNGCKVQALLAYPFHHKDGISDEFAVDARLSVFMNARDDEGFMPLRTRNVESSIHVKDDAEMQKSTFKDNAILAFSLKADNSSYTWSDVKSEEDVVKEVSLNPARARSEVAAAFTEENAVMMRLVYEWRQVAEKQEDGSVVWKDDKESTQVTEAQSAFLPLKNDGTVDPDYAKAKTLQGNCNGDKAGVQALNCTWGKDVQLRLAVNLRVTLNDELWGKKTVDLVPACTYDDDNFNGWENYDTTGAMGFGLGGQPDPVMRFTTEIAFRYSQEGLKGLGSGQTAKISPKKLLIADPRFNHAPENWFALDEDSDLVKNDWISKNRVGEAGCDGDVFMATSDQGYLQSVYELAFLPRLSDLDGKLDNQWWGFGEVSLRGVDWKEYATDAAKAYHQAYMWRTFRTFATSGASEDEGFEDIGFVSGRTGFRINPFSDSTNVIMAAFANTPHDWRVASTNNQEFALESMTAAAFNKDHAWNEYSSEENGKLAWIDLQDVASQLMENIRRTAANRGKDAEWHEAFHGLEWWSKKENEKSFCGFELDGKSSALKTVDRKFLFGYWHDCFAARQQLFLFFVRAEPLMMGGGAAGATPPQLGARAVALVWRDPSPTDNDNAPHRTRILFYRQFD